MACFLHLTGRRALVLCYSVSHNVLFLFRMTGLRSKQYAFEKIVGPIRHNEPPHANSPGVATVLSHTARASMSMTPTTITTTTKTTRDRGDRYGLMEWAQ